MTLLSRKADYALLILSYLHQHEPGATARAIAEQFGLSRPFVANILKELCHKGFVASHRGVKGGYALARAGRHDQPRRVARSHRGGFRLTMCNADGARPRRTLLARERLHGEGADGGGPPPADRGASRGHAGGAVRPDAPTAVRAARAAAARATSAAAVAVETAAA